MAYLLDTSVLVHLARNTASFRPVFATIRLTEGDFQPAISIVTHGEILGFAKKKSWPTAKLKSLEEILGKLVVLPIDNVSVVERYAELDAENAKGLNIGQNDLWIAATAIHYGLTLLTTDGDFERCPEPLQYIRYHQQTGVEVSRRILIPQDQIPS